MDPMQSRAPVIEDDMRNPLSTPLHSSDFTHAVIAVVGGICLVGMGQEFQVHTSGTSGTIKFLTVMVQARFCLFLRRPTSYETMIVLNPWFGAIALQLLLKLRTADVIKDIFYLSKVIILCGEYLYFNPTVAILIRSSINSVTPQCNKVHISAKSA